MTKTSIFVKKNDHALLLVFVWMFLMLNPSFVDLNFWNFCTILDYSVSFIGSTAYSIKFLSIHAILNKQYFSQAKTFLHYWFVGWVDAATTRVLTWSQYKISLTKNLTYVMQVHNAKWLYTVDFLHLPIWPSKLIYHLTSFDKLKNLIAWCNSTMQNLFGHWMWMSLIWAIDLCLILLQKWWFGVRAQFDFMPRDKVTS